MKNKIFDQIVRFIKRKNLWSVTNNNRIISYIIVISIIFLLRVIIFANQYGAIEHDSGWYLGVARNLAQRGIYASYTNTVINPEKGAYSSLHGRFSVQDEKGFVYFPAGVTAGPGFIIPQAIFLKILGFNWWQFRLFPLLSFFSLLIILFYFAYLLGGIVSLIIIQLFLWLHTEMYSTFAYESFAEHVALLYFFFSLFFINKAQQKQKSISKYFVSGIFLALSILTKTIILQLVLAFFVLFIYQLISSKKKKQIINNWFVFLAGFLLPILLFEAYRYIALISNFGIEGFKAANQDFFLTFKNYGSGLNLKGIDWSFAYKKLAVWKKIGFLNYLIPFFLIFLSFITFLKYKKYFTLYFLLAISFFSSFLWFILASTSGWTRHAWHSLLIGLLIIASVIGKLYSIKNYKLKLLFSACLILFLTSLDCKQMTPNFLIDNTVLIKWNRQRYSDSIQGLPHAPIFSFQDQIDLKQYFENNIKQEDKIYYLGWFLVSEASTITDKVFFTLDRYLTYNHKNNSNGKSFLILGPYQKGELSIVGREYHDKKISLLCRRIVFINDSYTLCELKENLIYTNYAYQ